MGDGFVCYRSRGGRQWHIPDEHGFAWCGLPKGSMEMLQGEPWSETPDQDRCQTCRRLAPLPFEFIRLRDGKRLSERVVEHPRPRRGRRAGDSWAWSDPGTRTLRFWGELGTGTPRRHPPETNPDAGPYPAARP